MSVPIFILAAGASRRLGRPKQLVLFDGEPLLRRQCRVAIDAGIGPVFAVLGCGAEGCAAVIADLAVKALVNQHWEEGVAASLRLAAIQAIADRATALLILHGDQHAITADHLRTLHTTWSSQASTPHLARDGDHVGPPVIIPADHFDAMLSLSGDVGARRILRSPIEVPLPGAGRDLNQPSQLPA